MVFALVVGLVVGGILGHSDVAHGSIFQLGRYSGHPLTWSDTVSYLTRLEPLTLQRSFPRMHVYPALCLFVFACSEWPVYSGRIRDVWHPDGLDGVLQASRHRGGQRELGVLQTGAFICVQTTEIMLVLQHTHTPLSIGTIAHKSLFLSSALLFHQSERSRHCQQSETAGPDCTNPAGWRGREKKGWLLGGVWRKASPGRADFLWKNQNL